MRIGGQRASDGLWAIISETEEGGTVALLPTRVAAAEVVSQWAADQSAHETEFQTTLARLGSPPHGSGLEVDVDESLVLRLGGLKF